MRVTVCEVVPEEFRVEPYAVVRPYCREAVLDSFVVHVMVAPLVVMEETLTPEMEGGVVSGGNMGLFTVTTIGLETVMFPAASRAVAVIVREPLGIAVISHILE